VGSESCPAGEIDRAHSRRAKTAPVTLSQRLPPARGTG